MRKAIAAFTTIAVLVGNCQIFGVAASNEEEENDGWTMIWNDEFDGDTLDTSKWSCQTGNGYYGWGNYEKEYYTEENVTVSDGSLKITAKKESKGGCSYTSGRIRTVTDNGEKLFTAKYGKFEARIKLPEGQGLWPAFWMMPADSVYGSWPLSGEIDIMEARGRVLDQVSGTIHYGESGSNHRSSSGKYTFDEENDITGYHVYGVEWNENTIIWYVDGVEYYRTSNWYTMTDDGEISNYPAPFDQEFYLILNLAVGGNYDNYLVPEDSALPAQMEVDYVRVYQKNEGYAASGIKMPDGERDVEGYEAIAKYYGNNLLNDLSTVNSTIVDRDSTRISAGKWYFLNYSKYGGDAALEKVDVDGETFANINITDGGTST